MRICFTATQVNHNTSKPQHKLTFRTSLYHVNNSWNVKLSNVCSTNTELEFKSENNFVW